MTTYDQLRDAIHLDGYEAGLKAANGEIERLRTQLAAAEQRVRELESNPLPFILSQLPEAKWVGGAYDYSDPGVPPDQHYVWEASNGGTYNVHYHGDENHWTWGACYVDYYDETGPIDCPSLEAGQAACRADYERRVGEIFRKDGE